MSAVTFYEVWNTRDRKWAAFLGRQTGERKGGTYTVFSLQCGKPLVAPYPKGGRYPETPGRNFKGRCRRNTGQEEGGTHVFYSDFSGHGTETILVWAPWNARA